MRATAYTHRDIMTRRRRKPHLQGHLFPESVYTKMPKGTRARIRLAAADAGMTTREWLRVLIDRQLAREDRARRAA